MCIPQAPSYIRDFEQLGFGMFVHLGLYSDLQMGEWAYHIHHLSPTDYRARKQNFAVTGLDEIIDTAKSAGCRYVILTTRHHDGFSLYDTRGLSDFDVMHTPYGKDLVAEFVSRCREADLVPFLYHTTLDWSREDFETDFDSYLDYLYQSVEILCTSYGKIGGLWFDGNWAKKDADWKEDRLYAMIRYHQPDAMIINNTGLHARGQTGHPQIDAVTFERGMAKPPDRNGMEKYIAGEMCQTLCDHWGAADDINYKSVGHLVEELCLCRKVGANYLLNIAPNANGTVPKLQQGIMECLGRWMAVYGKAIYQGRPYLCWEDKREFLLRDVSDASIAYLFRFDPGHSGGDDNVLPVFDGDDTLILDGVEEKVLSMTLMDNGRQIPFTQQEKRLTVRVPGFPYGKGYCVRVVEIRFAT